MAVAKPAVKLDEDGIFGQLTRNAWAWLCGFDTAKTVGATIHTQGSSTSTQQSAVRKWQTWINNHSAALKNNWVVSGNVMIGSKPVYDYLRQLSGSSVGATNSIVVDGNWGPIVRLATATWLWSPKGGKVSAVEAVEASLGGFGEQDTVGHVKALQRFLNVQMGFVTSSDNPFVSPKLAGE